MTFDGVVRRAPVTRRCEQGPGEAGRPVGEGWRGQSAGGTPQGTGVRAGSRVPKSAAVGLILIRKGR